MGTVSKRESSTGLAIESAYRRSEGVDPLPLSPSNLARQNPALGLCSDLHKIVHSFRAAHNDDSLESRVMRYPIEAAPETERPAIEHFSATNNYAALRRGPRLLPLYPPLNEDALILACKEIRAALVWKCG